ncbi:MAG: LPS export ABC transporter periplasmic protein LptC [Gammaproteobacteria bacterium]
MTLGLLSVGSVALLSWWLNNLQQQENAPQPPRLVGPDLTLNEFTTEVTAVDGALLYRLNAPELTHKPDDKESVIQKPHLVFYPTSGGDITLHAEQAVLNDNHRLITLPGDILIQSSATEKRDPINVQTSDVQVFPQKREAVTQAVTQVVSTRWHVRGQGMRLNLQNNMLDIDRDARGYYAP